MAGSSQQPDRLANQYITLPNGTKRPMKPLDVVLRELREGVAPAKAIEPSRHPLEARFKVYAAERGGVAQAHAPKTCGFLCSGEPHFYAGPVCRFCKERFFSGSRHTRVSNPSQSTTTSRDSVRHSTPMSARSSQTAYTNWTRLSSTGTLSCTERRTRKLPGDGAATRNSRRHSVREPKTPSAGLASASLQRSIKKDRVPMYVHLPVMWTAARLPRMNPVDLRKYLEPGLPQRCLDQDGTLSIPDRTLPIRPSLTSRAKLHEHLRCDLRVDARAR